MAGAAPALAAEPRSTALLSFGDDKAVLPLTPYVGGLHAHKHVLPAVAKPPWPRATGFGRRPGDEYDCGVDLTSTVPATAGSRSARTGC